MRRAVTLAAAALLLGAVTLSAQAHPNFSGTWTMDTTGMGAMGGGGGGGGGRGGGGGGGGGGRGGGFAGGPMKIVMDGSKMTVTQTRGQNETVSVYNLDGSDSKNTTQGRGGAVEATSNATWAGVTLSIATKRTGQDGTVQTTTAVYAMDGAQMTITTTAPGRNGGAPTPRTVKYNKSM